MNGATTERAQGVCPADWHVPSDCELMYLENSLGMSTTDQQNTGWRISGSVGSKLSMSTNPGTNSSGFTALLTGYRFTSGSFFYRGSYGIWWSSSVNAVGSAVPYRSLNNGQPGVLRLSESKARSHSVRCLKD